jgi:hypothetical protein
MVRCAPLLGIGEPKMSRAKYVLPLMIGVAPVLSACGLFVPEMQEFYKAPTDEKFDENTLVNQIQCELHKGVQDTLANSGKGAFSGKSVDWLNKWGAKVTLALTVDEKGGLNPGLTFMQPMQNEMFKFPTGNVTQSQSFSLGLGIQASSDATRKETIGFTYAFADLLKKKPITEACSDENGMLINSDLKIGQFIENKAFIAKVPGTVNPSKKGDSPFSAFTYEATFVVVYGGSITPTWKLAQISANASSSFLSLVRTKTNDIIITMGPVNTDSTPTAPATLGSEAEQAHLAALIGQAVANSIQSQQH